MAGKDVSVSPTGKYIFKWSPKVATKFVDPMIAVLYSQSQRRRGVICEFEENLKIDYEAMRYFKY